MTETTQETRYRLRKDDRIVGYARQVYGKLYYSADNFWWSGVSIPHIQKDQSIKIRDKNNRMLYENDIIMLRRDGKKNYFAITFDEMINCFYLLNLHTNELLPGKAEEHIQQAEKFEFVSFQFIN